MSAPRLHNVLLPVTLTARLRVDALAVEHHFTVTWRVCRPGRPELLRANLFVATHAEMERLVRCAERWASSTPREALTSLELVTWSLEDGEVNPALSFRVLAPRARTALVEPALSIEVRWRARWVAAPPVFGVLRIRVSLAELSDLRARIERWTRVVHPEALESLRATATNATSGVVIDRLEAGKERVAAPDDDVFLVLRSAGALDSEFRHYVALPNAAHADELIAEMARDDDGWIIEAVSRERFERGEPGLDAAKAVIGSALDEAAGEVRFAPRRFEHEGPSQTVPVPPS